MSGNSAALGPKRIHQLDGLRGIAIFLVLIWHFFMRIETGDGNNAVEGLKRVFSTTWSGVDLFFVLSGFLIGGILIDNRGTTGYFKTFYIRRAYRILPLYFLLLLSYGLVFLFTDWQSNQDLMVLIESKFPVFSFLVFVQNFLMTAYSDFGPTWLSVTWSLSIEEQFYIVLPLLIAVIPPRILPLLSVLCVVLAPLFRMLLIHEFPTYWAGTFVLLPARMDALFWGVLGAWLVRKQSLKTFFDRKPHLLYVLFLFSGLSVFWLTWSHLGFISTTMSSFGYSCFGLFYLSILLVCLFSKNRVVQFVIQLKPLRGIGFVSYFVYLFHMPIVGLLHHLFHGQVPHHRSGEGIIATLVSLVVLFSLSALSYRFLELPLIKQGKKYRYYSKTV